MLIVQRTVFVPRSPLNYSLFRGGQSILSFRLSTAINGEREHNGWIVNGFAVLMSSNKSETISIKFVGKQESSHTLCYTN